MELRQQNKHLYSRAGFGISINEYAHPLPIQEVVDKLFSADRPGEVVVITDEEWAANSPKAMKGVTEKTTRKELEKNFRQRTKDINLLWVQSMVSGNCPLLEKTALFWHGHFATHTNNPYYDQQLLQIFRKNALGNFRDMLREVSKSAAMLQYLNNRQNKKRHPNENFAREVMELFTLGRGHYTEDDVKDAARSFTGWTFDDEGNFAFNRKQHDEGDKKFLGRYGNFTGDDILDMLLEQKQTAVFITQKIYRYFVSDEKIDDKRVKRLASGFYESGYDIGVLLRNIFTSNWFYDEQVAGAKVKSPVELLAGYQRTLPIQFENEKTILNLQRTLGQYLFNPPNVAGWPGGRAWIDSSSLVIRMRLPEALFLSKELDLSLKESDAEMMSMGRMAAGKDTQPSKPFKVGKVTVDWIAYNAYWRQHAREALPRMIADYLLPRSISDEQLKEINSFADNDNLDEYIKSLTVLIMELPEYQLA